MSIEKGMWLECIEDSEDAMLVEGYSKYVVFFIDAKDINNSVLLNKEKVIRLRNSLNEWLEEK